jgi:preprotein translocase subunit YajC
MTTLILTLVLCGLVTVLYFFMNAVDKEHKKRQNESSNTKGDKT